MDPSSSSSSKRKRDSDSFDDEPSCKKPKYDVFLNYAFEDIGNGFVSHLKGALDLKSFTTSDHTLLPAGEDAYSELSKAIKESEMFVVVFSHKYASSERCLDELVNLMDCSRKLGEENVFPMRKVLPVFFKVKPSDVKSQHGPFMEAFQAHEINTEVDPERLKKWKEALKEAGGLSGLEILQYGDEAKFVKKIVKELLKMQSPQRLHVTDHPLVGIGSRAEELISTLRLDRQDIVLVVTVLGISGIGKTTVVKEVYNRIADQKFELSCFVADIDHICRAPNWKIELPNLLISCLTRHDKLSIMHYHNDRVTKIKRLLLGKKVLLVLDGIDDNRQLDALGINPNWFGEGSRIIVITRDKRSLGGHMPYVTYHTRLLNRRESLHLFTQLLSASNDPVTRMIIEEGVNHAGGLPLVLKVWSGHFKNIKIEAWPEALEKLKRIPHRDVHEQLKISYDSLTYEAKQLFLDIACFFFLYNEKNLVVKVLEDEVIGYFPGNEIEVLVDRSLVELQGSDFNLTMQHAIREMGHEVVRQENQREPGQRSRLCHKTEVMRVLKECSGSESIESIILINMEFFEDKNKEVIVSLEALRKMSNLRLFHLQDKKLSWRNSSNDEMTAPLTFKKLRYMAWECFPFKSINNVDMGNHVVVLRLTWSKLVTLWEGIKSLKKLRILDVSYSESLTKTNDFFGLENLEELNFEHCRSLEEMDSSLGCLHKLAILNLTRCVCLRMIPWGKLSSIRQLHLTSLEEHVCLLQLHNLNTLVLTSCNTRSIPNLPRNITTIKACSCKSLVSFPSNMSELTSLTVLDFYFCVKLGSENPLFLMELRGLTNLTHLKMNNCSVSQVPSEIGNLVSLVEIDLSGNTFLALPYSLSNLSRLVTLRIEGCSELRSLPLLPSNLEVIKASGCSLLNIMPFLWMQRGYIFLTKACKKSSVSKPLMIEVERMETHQIPDCCSYRKKGDVLSLEAPKHLDKKICGIILYAKGFILDAPKLFNKTKNTSRCLAKLLSRGHHMQVMFYPLDDTTLVVEAGDTLEIEFAPPNLSRCKLGLIYDCDVMDSKLVLQNVNADIPHDTNGDYDDWDLFI